MLAIAVDSPVPTPPQAAGEAVRSAPSGFNLLVPPYRFALIEAGLSRGGYPKPRNVRFLKRLRLRTILSLVPSPPEPELAQFAAAHNITLVHLAVEKCKENVPLTYPIVVQALELMINADRQPLYVHCLNGSNVTGMLVMCLRKLQIWTMSFAAMEFTRFIRDGSISSEEREFVDKFCSEIEVPRNIPSWLWNGQVMSRKHPSLKLNLSLRESTLSLNSASTSAQQQQDKEPGNDMKEFRSRFSADIMGQASLSLEDHQMQHSAEYEDMVIDEDTPVSQTLQALALEGLE